MRRPAVSKSNETKGPTVPTSKPSKKPAVDDKEVGQKRKLSPDNLDEPQKKKRRVEKITSSFQRENMGAQEPGTQRKNTDTNMI